MNSKQLRKEIVKQLKDADAKGTGYVSTRIMTAIKNHVDYVIGEDDDKTIWFAGDSSKHPTAEDRNELRAEQRNRAGGY